jgi:AraC family transcriptional regulator
MTDIGLPFDQPAPRARTLAAGVGWSLSEFVCTAGPEARPFEERHDGFSVAAVASGSFTYRTGVGRARLHPGALLLGNAGHCYECGHDHSTGDRCISVNVSDELFGEVAATRAASARFAFPVAALPASRTLTPVVAELQAAARRATPTGLEHLAIRVVETAIDVLADGSAIVTRAAPRDERRVAEVVRWIEERSDEALDLDHLAALAGLSKYYFLRLFRGLVGQSPYQYLLGIRMRRAALRIAASTEPVSAIAFDCGFGDLSTFNDGFRRQFGVTPSAWRRRMSGAA